MKSKTASRSKKASTPSLIDATGPTELFLPVRQRLGARATAPQCTAVPTDTPKVSNSSYTLDTEQAGKLGISYLGTGDASIDHKMKVFVREYAKYNTCEATDGKSTLQYGAVWRATVLIDETDATGKVNFAVVAASATLKNVSVQVTVSHQGFANQVPIDVAGQAAMQATAQGLNVASFVKFSEEVEKAISAVIQSPVATPLQLIGTRSNEAEILLDSVVRTFALSYIAAGKGCLEPIADFPVKSKRVERIIRETYDQLSPTPCDASNQVTRLNAKQLLNGLKVSTSWW
ncbi:MAG: hypothetical protein ABSE46_19375 [Terracidiphilus sp.]|jgi:hypothetical protein